MDAMPLVLLPPTEDAKGDGVSWFEVAAGQEGLLLARGPDGSEIARAEVKRVGRRQGTVELAAGEISAYYSFELIGSGSDLSIRVDAGGKSTMIGTGQSDDAVAGIDLDPDQVGLVAMWGGLRDPLLTLADDIAGSGPADSADWGLAACGLTWMGVSVGVGACATGFLVSCAASLVGAGTFVEHCV